VTALAVLGNLCRDVVAGAPPRPGGGVFYATRALARLGVNARVAASCRSADRELLLPPLEAFGLPVDWYESEATTEYSFHYEGDRRIMRQTAVGDPWSPGQALEAVGDATWVHVAALVRTDFPEATLAALAGGGRRRLLVDAQGLVRTADLGPLRTNGEVGNAFRYVSILKLNDEEAQTLLGSAEPEDLTVLGVPEIVFTLGSRGSVVVTPDAVERVPALKVSRGVDPTGAGDTFSAAYLSARAAGVEPIAAAHRATSTVAAFLAGD
jgi:sugar/nucleoside kinase (ribokinase family)